MIYDRLNKAFQKLQDDLEAFLGTIDKCSITAKQIYEKISQEEDLNNGGDSSNDLLQEPNNYDNFSVNTS
jgi:hypothetical protein